MSEPTARALTSAKQINRLNGYVVANGQWQLDVAHVIDEALEPLRRIICEGACINGDDDLTLAETLRLIAHELGE